MDAEAAARVAGAAEAAAARQALGAELAAAAATFDRCGTTSTGTVLDR
eukprot:SAG22_NODE_1064_length_5756_cov_48.259502_10_plen_48_part_00